MEAKDLVIGAKYVPHAKSIGDSLEDSYVLKEAKKMNQTFLYYTGTSATDGFTKGAHMFDCDSNTGSGDFFLPSDVTLYVDPNEISDVDKMKEEIKNIELSSQSKISEIEDKIEFCEEAGITKYDPELHRIWAALESLYKYSSNMERAKAILNFKL